VTPKTSDFVGGEEEPQPDQIVVIPDFAEELKAKFREAGR